MAQKGNKESRAAEALAMKDEQLRILGEQNSKLLTSLGALDDELHALKALKLRLEDENRALRDDNFALQSKTRAAEAGLVKAQTSAAERETQLKVLTDHNTELLRLLEHEEAQTSALASSHSSAKAELEALQTRYASLLATARTHEEVATRASREGQLRAEEVRLLRNESEQLRACNTELKMKTTVELEALQEQLRVRKDKQYQLLEKLQQLEEAKRQGDDQLAAQEERLRGLHTRGQELETQVQLEAKAKRAQLDANKALFLENGALSKDKRELQLRVDRAEQERARMEAENRDSAEQLREMAEKVFQLLERLKLAELGKTKAVDALKLKEGELLALKKKNARLLKEGTQEGKARVKSELDKKVVLEQLGALKKHNAQLSLRCGDEVKAKLAEAAAREQLDGKLQTMGSRVAFLLNKMQADEEAKLVSKEEAKKMSAQLASLQDQSAELALKLHAATESNRVVTEALRCKQDELDAAGIKLEAAHRKMGELSAALETSGLPSRDFDGDNNGGSSNARGSNQDSPLHPDDAAANAANGRFFVEARATHGGLLVIKAKRLAAAPEIQQRNVAFLDRVGINAFLKRAQKSLNTKQMLVERLAALLSTMATGEDAVDDARAQAAAKGEQLAHVSRKAALLQEKLTTEEDAKRKTLLRYVHEIKARSSEAASSSSSTSSTASGVGVLKLPESGVGDEEVHAIAALLRSATTVRELQLRGNGISNEGARAIAAVLSSASCGIRAVDLRGNRITKEGVKVLAEALERNERTKHVYVHAGGKIEALGTTAVAAGMASPTMVNAQLMSSASPSVGASLIGVETVCIVDVREQLDPPGSDDSLFFSSDLDELDIKAGATPMSTAANGPGSAFKLKFAGLGSSSLASADPESSNRLFARRPLSAATLKKQREKLAAQRKKKQEEAKRIARKEAEWSGRAGGLDSSPSPAPLGTAKKLPPIASVSRTNSAPAFQKADDTDPAVQQEPEVTR